ncbi:MAG TPA: YceI family protein [Vicinamibacteria bacterium]|nr:YceI family protein [Vicinamibacteria bacterium]
MRMLSLTALSLALLAGAVQAEVYNADPAHSEVMFSVRHMTVTKVTGRFNEFSATITGDAAKPEASTVEFTIKAASIDTKEAGRDKHLKSADFFDVEKFPEITFKSSKITAKGQNKYDVAGTLTMHGVSKEITLPVVMAGPVKDPRGNEKFGFEVTTTLNRKDYGVSWNRALDAGGVVVSDEVQVSINLEAAKAKPADAPATK